MSKEVMQMALDALTAMNGQLTVQGIYIDVDKEIKAIFSALAQPEPVAVWELEGDGWDTIADPEWMETLPVGTKLYTAPPQRKEWVGLTAYEIQELHLEHPHWGNFTCAIEAKLKEKNT